MTINKKDAKQLIDGLVFALYFSFKKSLLQNET